MNTKNLKLEKIEDFFKEKIKLNPNNLEANFNLARIYKEKGEHKKAKLLYESIYLGLIFKAFRKLFSASSKFNFFS